MAAQTRNTRGFTLTEVLAAIAVFAILSAMVATGISLALNVKEDSKFISDSDVLASTINTALADCIHYQDTVDNQAGVWLHGKNITYDSTHPLELKVDGDGHFVVSGVYNGNPVEERLLNAGVYGDLKISATEAHSTDFSGGVKYTIVGNPNKASQVKKVDTKYANLKRIG